MSSRRMFDVAAPCSLRSRLTEQSLSPLSKKVGGGSGLGGASRGERAKRELLGDGEADRRGEVAEHPVREPLLEVRVGCAREASHFAIQLGELVVDDLANLGIA